MVVRFLSTRPVVRSGYWVRLLEVQRRNLRPRQRGVVGLPASLAAGAGPEERRRWMHRVWWRQWSFLPSLSPSNPVRFTSTTPHLS